MQEMQVQSLGREDPLEEEMATHSNILAWEIPWTEEPGGLQSPRGRKELDMSEQVSSCYLISEISMKQILELDHPLSLASWH